MQDNGWMVLSMEKEDLYKEMEFNIMANGKMERSMVMVRF